MTSTYSIADYSIITTADEIEAGDVVEFTPCPDDDTIIGGTVAKAAPSWCGWHVIRIGTTDWYLPAELPVRVQNTAHDVDACVWCGLARLQRVTNNPTSGHSR
jgi:hypothetical protein